MTADKERQYRIDLMTIGFSFAKQDAELYATAPELAAVLAEILEASTLTPGDCFTDGKPNANHGRESRAKMKARRLLASLPIAFTGPPGAVKVA